MSHPKIRPNRLARGILVVATVLAAWIAPLGAVEAEGPERSLAVAVNTVRADFPNALEFHLIYTGVVQPRNVDLEFSIKPVHSCDGGTVRSARFPGHTGIVWRWEPSDDQPIPPGQDVRWRWRVTDAGGNVHVSHPKEFVWTDKRFAWRTHTKDELSVHWYGRYPEFGSHLIDFLEPQLDRIESIESSRKPVNVFIYESEQDAGPGALLRRDGGNPFRAFNTVLTVTPEEFSEDHLSALIHELAHIAVQDRAFNCFGGLPYWLEEGIAMLAEGDISQDMRRAFAEARLIERFVPLRSLGAPFRQAANAPPGQFLENHNQLVRYAQSRSLVEVLIDEFGWEGIASLLDSFKYGVTLDDALKLAFGLDIDQTELLWRTRVGLPEQGPAVASSPRSP